MIDIETFMYGHPLTDQHLDDLGWVDQKTAMFYTRRRRTTLWRYRQKYEEVEWEVFAGLVYYRLKPLVRLVQRLDRAGVPASGTDQH